MPDLTLYREDVDTLMSIMHEFRACTRRKVNIEGLQLNERELELYREADRLADLFVDRVVQRLHSPREVEVELDL